MRRIQAIRRPTLFTALLLGLVLVLARSGGDLREAYSEPTPTLSVPIRWCVVGDDADDDDVLDAGGQGAPAVTNPANVGESNTDMILWQRHERPSEHTFIPDAGVTLRSALWNIVEDPDLRFPIIPDQDTTDPDHQVGDILNPSIDATELNATYNACIQEWSDDHEVGDIGIVAVNARKIVDESGGGTFVGFGRSNSDGKGNVGARRLVVEDNAWSLPASGMNTSSVDDPDDKLVGHEAGHTTANFDHTCSNTNIMRTGRRDTDGDDLLDNSRVSSNVDQVTDSGADGDECTDDDTTQKVDQIPLFRSAAAEVPGCTILGTTDPCSSKSDIRTDALRDTGEPFLDISTLRVSESSGGTTEFGHELFLPLTDESLADFSSLEYFVFADLDNDSGTGGSPADLGLGLPSGLEGADLITRVRMSEIIVDSPPTFFVGETLWKFQGGSFVEISDPSIQARVDENVDIGDGAGEPSQTHTSDTVVIEFSNDVRGPVSTPFRLQALSRGNRSPEEPVIDRLPDPFGGARPVRLRHPTFPVCQVEPSPVPAGGLATVQVSGLLPERGLHVVFGADLVANGTTDASGAATVELLVPSDAREGPHLISVGNDGTALTADCIANVIGGPPQIATGTPLTNLWLCDQATTTCDNKASGVEEVDLGLDIDRAVASRDPKCTGFPNFRPPEDCPRQSIGAFEFEVRYDAKLVSVTVEPGGVFAGRPEVHCASTPGEGFVQFRCVTKGKPPDAPRGPGSLAVIRVRPTADVRSTLVANQLNGIATQLINQDCQLSDLQGHPIAIDGCDDAAITIRYLEGDVHADCVVDVHDQQQIAFRWGSRLGQLLFNDRFDLEPSYPKKGDGDVDAKDLQLVYGRHGSTCKAPHPAQPPVDPKAKVEPPAGG